MCGSGNLAQVYFDVLPRRLTVDELEMAYPGMLAELVSHAGVGFVVSMPTTINPSCWVRTAAGI